MAPAYDVFGPHVTIDYGADAREPQVTRFDRDALCGDHGFRTRVAVTVQDHGAVYSLRQRLFESATKMCVSIGTLLKRRCNPILQAEGSNAS